MELIYEGNWHTYEEWGAVRIFEDNNGNFYAQTGGHSVYASAHEPDWTGPFLISMQEALDLIDEWDQIEKENEDFWNHNGGF